MNMHQGKNPKLDRPLDHGTEIDLQTPTLIPSDFLPDIHARLVMYKKIASAPDTPILNDIEAEMIDRFGALPNPTQSLFRITELKLKAKNLGVKKIKLGGQGGRIRFSPDANVDPAKFINLIQDNSRDYQLKGPGNLQVKRSFENIEDKVGFLEDFFDKLGVPISD